MSASNPITLTTQILKQFLDEYLDIEGIEDFSWNGLQVDSGTDHIKKIAFSVDAAEETITKAVAAGANMLIVHHGLFWRATDPSITGYNLKRIPPLLANKLSLYCAHLPLDRHPEVGNNAQILKLLGAEIRSEFTFSAGKNVGWIGEIATGVGLSQIGETLNSQLDTSSKILAHGPEVIKKIAVCTGGTSTSAYYEAISKEVDLIITGEEKEIYQLSKDAGLNVIFAGHYATETIGLKALANILQQRYTVETEFIEAPTGI